MFEIEGAKFVTYEEGFEALGTLKRALGHITKQFSLEMPRPEAQAHFDARALIINKYMALLDEMELEYTYGRTGENGVIR